MRDDSTIDWVPSELKNERMMKVFIPLSIVFCPT